MNRLLIVAVALALSGITPLSAGTIRPKPLSPSETRVTQTATPSYFVYSQALDASGPSVPSTFSSRPTALANEEFVPVDAPEPTSMLLLGSGLLGLAGFIRLRHRSKK